MKIHITNIYGFNKSDEYIQKQHEYAEIGRSLGFREMGIFRYAVDSDSDSELSRRLDGIIASIEKEDVVFVQIPTGNGMKFDSSLINRLKAYQSKVILMIHEFYEDMEWINLYKSVKFSVVFGRKEKSFYDRHGLTAYLLSSKNEFSVKKMYFDLINEIFTFEEKKIDGSDMIHVAFGLYDKTGDYSIWVGVAMQSILDHTNSNVYFHILHDDTLNDENKNKLIEICKNTNSCVEFHLIDVNEFNQIASQVKNYTIGSVFRIMIPEVLKELSKVLYLDADLFVNLDIQELWDIDLEGNCLGAVRDLDILNRTVGALPVMKNECNYDEYFNSGVLSMNLDAIRNHGNMKEEIIHYLICNTDSDLPDQDALNVVYRGRIKFIDQKYNYFVRTVRNNHEIELKKRIYHYVGTRCFLSHLNDVDIEFYKTVARSPWGQKSADVILKRSISRTVDRVNLYEKILDTITSSDKIRIYVGNDWVTKTTMEIIHKSEKDVQVLEMNDLKDLVNSYRDRGIEFVIFVTARFHNCIEYLEDMGLVNDKDFFLMQRFMSDLKGGFI